MSTPAFQPIALHRAGERITRILYVDGLPVDAALATQDGREIIVIRAGLPRPRRKAAIRALCARTGIRHGALVLPLIAQALRGTATKAATASTVGSSPNTQAPSHVGRIALATVGILSVAGAITATSLTGGFSNGLPLMPRRTGALPSASPTIGPPKHPVHTPPLSTKPLSYLGVYEPGSNDSYGPISEFGQTAGRAPNIVLAYMGWGQNLLTTFVDNAYDHDAVPLIQLDPDNVSLTSIAYDGQDTYIKTLADEVAAYGHPVIIGFAHEPNGNWYSWGSGRSSPTTYIAAWQHLVDGFRQQGADNVTWLWTINVVGQRGPSHWWPGASYVNWIGIDGYYESRNQTFATLFGPILEQVRDFTSDPVLISETGVSPRACQIRGITDLFSAMSGSPYLGFVWFDKNQTGGLSRQPWRLESAPDTVIDAFRRDARHDFRPAPFPVGRNPVRSPSPSPLLPLPTPSLPALP